MDGALVVDVDPVHLCYRLPTDEYRFGPRCGPLSEDAYGTCSQVNFKSDVENNLFNEKSQWLKCQICGQKVKENFVWLVTFLFQKTLKNF